MSDPITLFRNIMGLSLKRKAIVYEDDSDYFVPKRVVIVSGYFSPIHSGHIEYFRMAKEFAGEEGIVYAIVNSDAQSILKKNYSFVPEDDRLAVVTSCKYIEKAILSIDTDRSVCATIRMLCYMAKKGCTFHIPTHFVNGGDVTQTAKCPEEPICKSNKIELVYGLGDKIQSSSWIIEDSVKKAYEEIYGVVEDKEEIKDEDDDEDEDKDEDKDEDEDKIKKEINEEDSEDDLDSYYKYVDTYTDDDEEF